MANTSIVDAKKIKKLEIETLDRFTDSRNSFIPIDKNILGLLEKFESTPSERLNSKEIDIKILSNEDSQSLMCKVVLLGDAGVGKTSIQKRYVHQRFSEDYLVTIGTEIALKYEKIGSHRIKFQIWDIAGHSQFHEVRKGYYSHVAGGVIVCDITKKETMTSLNDWIKELWTNNGKGPIPFILVGNKIDLQNPEVNLAVNKSLAKYIEAISSRTLKSHGFRVHYIPASAKTGENIQDIFKKVGIQIIAYENFLTEIKMKNTV
ncbi:MAG: Rab family GTPase [Candidatus Hodarchaeota archaeon]